VSHSRFLDPISAEKHRKPKRTANKTKLVPRGTRRGREKTPRGRAERAAGSCGARFEIIRDAPPPGSLPIDTMTSPHRVHTMGRGAPDGAHLRRGCKPLTRSKAAVPESTKTPLRLAHTVRKGPPPSSHHSEPKLRLCCRLCCRMYFAHATPLQHLPPPNYY
jgi:hypothetical protein